MTFNISQINTTILLITVNPRQQCRSTVKFNLNFISQIEKADRYTLYFLRYHTMADADF